MESHKMVEEYLTGLLGKESGAIRQFIDTLIKKWNPPTKPLSQDTLLEVYHRPNEEEMVLMAAKKPSAKHRKQEGNSPQQQDIQKKNVKFALLWSFCNT